MTIKKTHVLLTMSVNWADECDFYGFCIMNWYEYKRWLRDLHNPEKNRFPNALSFGTNQHVEFERVDDFLNRIQVRDITSYEARTIKRVFGKNTRWGNWP